MCGGRSLEGVLSLTPTPPANAFVPAEQLSVPQPVIPLDVFFCSTCHHVQLLDVVDPDYLFRHYVYVSGTSPVFVRHFREYAAAVIHDYLREPPALIVDIGSNDGTFLRNFVERGYTVVGVDPARDIAARASAAGMPTVAEFFTPGLAATIRDRHGPAGLVAANNVFAHADDLDGIARGVTTLLDHGGVFVFEVSYLGDLVEKILFDMIYHEHLAYHSVGPLVRFLRGHDLDVVRVQRVATHGGSIRCIAQRAGGPWPSDGSVERMLWLERETRLDRAQTFVEFSRRIEALKTRFVEMVSALGAEGRSFAGFGAPAKATTLMYHFGIGPETLRFIVDDSPWKQHLFTPGLHIPVVPADELYRRRPDEVIVLAWNFAPSIVANHERFRSMGGHFIVPLPELRRM